MDKLQHKTKKDVLSRIHLTAIFMVPVVFQRLSLVNLVAAPLTNVVGLSPDPGQS